MASSKNFLLEEMLVSRLFIPGYSLEVQVGGCFDGGHREVFLFGFMRGL